MNTRLIGPSAVLLAVALCMPVLSAELAPGGDAASAQSAVKVLSAESEDDLYRTLTSWVQTRYPDARVVMQEFRYVANDRALFILTTMLGDGSRRQFYFETPGLPVQFVRRKS
jgi:hypothetical protein